MQALEALPIKRPVKYLNFSKAQFSFISPPKQASEGDIDKRRAAALSEDHSLANWFGHPVHVADLVEGCEERDVGHGEEGGVRVSNTISSVQEVEFPIEECSVK